MPAPAPPRLPADLDRLVDPARCRRPEGLVVAAYTFPHFHRCAYNDRLYAKGWTEYVLARGARPWFAGHAQPRTPLLGELDERDPATWVTYVDLAVASGVDAFIWDWYWYDGAPAFHEALEEGYLPAPGRERTRFAVMWTNHPWAQWFPNTGVPADDGRQGGWELLTPAPESPAQVWRSLAYIVARYFHDPHYWRLDGAPLLVVWEAGRLLDAFGAAGTRALLDELRAFARKLGHPGVHVHASHGSFAHFGRLAEMGFDSYGIYNPLLVAAEGRPPQEELLDFGALAAQVVGDTWARIDAMSPLPFFPGISPGWDDTPRHTAPPRPQEPDRGRWPGTPILVDDSPAAFEALVRGALGFVNRPSAPPVITIGCWNEWTEGHYLLPDTRFGYGIARALARGLGLPGAGLPRRMFT